MDFEQSLVVELGAITGLENKVFPLYAVEGIRPPFVIYRSSEGREDQSLYGYLGTIFIECEIHVIGNSYGEMKTLTKEVIAKIASFFNRTIGGENGVFIKLVSYDQPTEVFEEEVRYYRASFDIRVRI